MELEPKLWLFADFSRKYLPHHTDTDTSTGTNN